MSRSFPSSSTVICAWWLASLAAPLAAQSVDRLDGKNVSVTQTTFKGRGAVQLTAAPNADNATSYAVL